MAQTFPVPGEVEVAFEVLWVVVEPMAEVQMCHPGDCRSDILAVHKYDIPGSGAILVEEDFPDGGPSDSWLDRKYNIPS